MKKLIVANWKMNGSKEFIEDFFDSIRRASLSLPMENEYVICPPSPYFSQVASLLAPLNKEKKSFFLGAQDCHPEASGAYTGDVSAPMLKDLGCQYVIVGHSERRRIEHGHQESDALVKRKAEVALRSGLTPIICVGETLEERDRGETIQRLISQISGSLPASDQEVVLAYEPIWAIGTGKVPSSDQIREVHAALRKHLDSLGLSQCRLLYGGSVTQDNAHDIMTIPNVDGLLIGGASLKSKELVQIWRNTK